MPYTATKQRVLDRGVPPDSFLDEMVAWGKSAPDEIFAPNQSSDVYASVVDALGPWGDLPHRRAGMLEVMRVLAGFESSWNWNEGRDTTNQTSVTSDTIEAGAWQVSANSMNFGQELKDLVRRSVGSLDGNAFQRAMKADHPLAMEYIARLLRRTTRHNGPVVRHEIDPWLRRDAVAEFQALLTPERTTRGPMIAPRPVIAPRPMIASRPKTAARPKTALRPKKASRPKKAPRPKKPARPKKSPRSKKPARPKKTTRPKAAARRKTAARPKKATRRARRTK